MVTFHSAGTESWFYGIGLGSYDCVDSGSLHWYVPSRSSPKPVLNISIDTMGYAFTFHVVTLLGNIPVGAYVHYPTISTDMLARVKSRKQWHTNSDAISSSLLLSNLKLMFDYSSFSQSTDVDDLMAQILPTIYVLLCVFTASSVFHHGQFIMD